MNRGDVVKVDWPFTDQTGSKSRPAVVVQADYLAGITDDTILVLNKRCVASCANILTYDEILIQRKIGVLSHDTMLLIDECLKSALGL